MQHIRIIGAAAPVRFERLSSSATAFNLEIDAVPGIQKEDQVAAAMRMVERRVQAIEQQQSAQGTLEDIDVSNTSNGARMELKLTDNGVWEPLVEDITQQFTLEFMEEVPLEEAEIVVAETRGFRRTDLGASAIRWLSVGQSAQGGQVIVEFTTAGQSRKAEVFQEHMGQQMGLFVRGMPVYQFVVEEDDVSGESFIIKVPQAQLAGVFADDVNTGLHVTFTSVQ